MQAETYEGWRECGSAPPVPRSIKSLINSHDRQNWFDHVGEHELLSYRQGLCPLNWTGIAGIPIVVAGLGLAAAYAAEAASHDDSATQSSITLLGSPAGNEPSPREGANPGSTGLAGESTQDGAQPPLPPTPRPPEPADRLDAAVNKVDSVPTAEPLPGQAPSGSRPTQSATAPRQSAPPRAAPHQPERPREPRRACPEVPTPLIPRRSSLTPRA